jgi:hypothetical protein
VTFPLQMLAPAVEERAETWDRLDMSRRAFSVEPNHGKPVVRVELESGAWLVQIMIWSSGEAELETIRLTDDRMINKHYDLTGRDDLDVLLDELVRLLVQDHVPEAGVVSTRPDPRRDKETRHHSPHHTVTHRAHRESGERQRTRALPRARPIRHDIQHGQ